MAGGGSSSESDTQYVQSPQQKQLWKALAPGIRDFKSFFQTGKPLWDLPELPQIPDITSMMPKEGWWNALDPTIRQGIMEPWLQGQNQLFEEFGSRGMGGSARGGTSGAFGQGVSDYWVNKAMPQIEQQGWNMISPALNTGWNAQWSNQQNQYAQQLQQLTWPYQALTQMTGYTLPTPVVSQGSSISPWGSAATGAASGAAVGTAIYPGIGTAVGAVGGGLAGYFGAGG